MITFKEFLEEAKLVYFIAKPLVNKGKIKTHHSMELKAVSAKAARERAAREFGLKPDQVKAVAKYVDDKHMNEGVAQDKDVKDREGTQPKKYFAKDAKGKEMSKSTKVARDRHFAKGKESDSNDSSAYKPAPGDETAETKPSKYTKKYKQMFGENAKTGLQKKADDSGISYSILKKVYDRGVAAWRTGHRPGTTPEQWGYARVNSFITGGKTRTTADADLWKQHKGK